MSNFPNTTWENNSLQRIASGKCKIAYIDNPFREFNHLKISTASKCPISNQFNRLWNFYFT